MSTTWGYFVLFAVLVSGCGAGLHPFLRGSPANGSGDGNNDPSPTASPFCSGDPTFQTYQEAAFVIGQADFTGEDLNSGELGPVAKGLNEPYGVPAFSAGYLWIPDFNNQRILGFSPFPEASDASAQIVIGQDSFGTSTSGTSATQLNDPNGVGVSGSSLFVLDNGNNRVLRYNTLPTVSGASASTVIVGHGDMTQTRSTCDASSFDAAEGFRVKDNLLIVPDLNHDRVLIWTTIPSAPNVPADIVLGQPDFGTCTAVGVTVSPSASNFDAPTDAATDGTRLVISDMNRHRVLIWNTFPTEDNQPADVVLGQPDFTSGTANQGSLSNRSLSDPLSVEIHGSKLYVSDAGNDRVMIWNSIPTENHTPADVVLGQPNFTTSGPITSRPITSRQGINGAAGVRACGNRLYVGQDGANRYSVFEGL